jgi:hypothetical protein
MLGHSFLRGRSGPSTSFKQAVPVEFPRPGIYSMGFVTSAQRNEDAKSKRLRRVWSVFIPTTPNPTTGFPISAQSSRILTDGIFRRNRTQADDALDGVGPDMSSRIRSASRTKMRIYVG